MSAFKISCCAAACALLVACGGGGGGDGAGPGPGTAPASAVPPTSVGDEVLVKLFNAADLQALMADNRLVLVEQFGRRPIYRLRTPAGSDVDALSARLETDRRVRFAEPNLLHETPEGQRGEAWAIGGDANTFATQWNGRALRLPEAHALSTGTGVTVAVLDTGVDASHPALAGRLVPGFDFVDFDNTPEKKAAQAIVASAMGRMLPAWWPR